ncbi:RHS repeat-associated core domain-containing protein [Motilimonas sp. E26]|uniref:RHS repeat domain-containing protein n=1 Tax=Motilimonas sp. E26 TaxID=2865674 RepID=UPI00249DE5AF|nr:RHS repeat-associated core domain-containing protein [Motilimonas sp. E26]
MTEESANGVTSYVYQTQSNRIETHNGMRVELDAVGNTLSSSLTGQQYRYNAEGRLAWLDNGTYVTQYQYNGLSERVIKEIGQDTYLYYYSTAGQLLETQYYQGATQVWSKQIIWLGSLPLAQVTQNATGSEIVYLHADHLNTPRKATNEQQQVVWQWSSDAYGNGAAHEDVDGDQQLTQIDLRFPGQLFDAESGLYYNYYRYYDPKTGRYITSDPIGLNGGMNTFAYVDGNPVSYIDPYGESATAVVGTWVAADTAVPDPTDLAWPKWFVYGAAFTGATAFDWAWTTWYNSEKAERKKAYAEYKDFQKQGYTRDNDPCKELKNRIEFIEKMIQYREAFDRNFPHNKYPNGRHAKPIAMDKEDVERLKKKYKEMCSDECS